MTPDWQERAACKGSGALFHGPERERPAARDARELAAKRICATCPADVRRACLEYGESQPASLRIRGVYGGLGEKDRRGLRRSLGQIARQQRERSAA